MSAVVLFMTLIARNIFCCDQVKFWTGYESSKSSPSHHAGLIGELIPGEATPLQVTQASGRVALKPPRPSRTAKLSPPRLA